MLDILSNFKPLICCSIYNVIVLCCCYLPKYSSCIIDKFVVNISTSHLSNNVKENCGWCSCVLAWIKILLIWISEKYQHFKLAFFAIASYNIISFIQQCFFQMQTIKHREKILKIKHKKCTKPFQTSLSHSLAFYKKSFS